MASCNSLEALSSYVQSQRELLSRTQREIERLHALKAEVEDDEGITADGISQKVHILATFYDASQDQCICSSVAANLDWMRKLGWTWT